MSIEELKANGAIDFLLEGPNSGGMSGYYYLQGNVYAYTVDFSESTLSEPIDAKLFMEANINNPNQRYRSMAEELRKLIV